MTAQGENFTNVDNRKKLDSPRLINDYSTDVKDHSNNFASSIDVSSLPLSDVSGPAISSPNIGNIENIIEDLTFQNLATPYQGSRVTGYGESLAQATSNPNFMNDFYDVVKNRRSYRVYKSDMPEKEKIDKILDVY